MANGGDRLSRPYLSTDMAERLLDRNAKLIAGVLRLRASANEAREKEGFVTATGTENSDPAAAKRFDRRADRLEDQLARNLAALARWANKVTFAVSAILSARRSHGRVPLMVSYTG